MATAYSQEPLTSASTTVGVHSASTPSIESWFATRGVTALLFTVVCLTWGTTWIGIKFAVETIPPLTAAGLRFALAFPVFVIIARLLGQPIAFPRDKWWFFAVVLFGYFSVPYFLLNYGEQFVLPGITALLFSAMPVLSVVFSWLLLRERLSLMQGLGIAMGMCGFAFILWEQGLLQPGSRLVGVLAVALAAALHGLCYVLTKRHGAQIGIVTFNTLPIGVAGIGMLLCGAVIEQPNWSDISAASWTATFYLAAVASVLGFCCYFLLLKRVSAIAASYVFLVFPLIAIAIDLVLQEQTLSVGFAIGCVLVLGGFLLTRPLRSDR